MRLNILSAGVALLLAAGSAMANTPEPGVSYKLTTEFRGTGMPMDVYNGGPQNNRTRLARDEDVTGQYWRFEPAEDGHYKITNEFRDGMCLDIEPADNRAELRRCGNLTGQLWRIDQEGPWVRLTTKFRGRNMCLDINPSNNHPVLRGCGDYTGQMWQLRRDQ